MLRRDGNSPVESPRAGKRAASGVLPAHNSGRCDRQPTGVRILNGTLLGGRYEVVSRLGGGATGVVYRARDPVLGREVAVKVVDVSRLGPGSADRVRREARLLAALDHPAIVPIHDFGGDGDVLFLVMPVVRGGTLRDLLRERPLRPAEAMALGADVAEALDYSHSRGVVHGDLKPENVLIDGEPGSGRARVTDFGLARALWEGGESGGGTAGYRAPDLEAGSGGGTAADLFSLGTLLHELLTGRLPDGTGADVRLAAAQPEAAALVSACLSPDPAARPASAGAVSARLRDLVGRSVAEPADFPADRAGVPRPPLAGRLRELAILERHLAAAADGERRVVALAGEAGLGKTRLVEEAVRRANSLGFRVLEARFSERERGLPHQAFCDLVRGACRGRGREAVSGGLADLAPELVSAFPALQDVQQLRPSVSGAQQPAVSQPEDRAAVFDLVARTLLRLAAGAPCLLVLENFHAAEASADAFGYAVRRLEGAPVVVLATFRPSEVDRRGAVGRLLDAWTGGPGFELIELSRLRAEEHRELVEQLAGGAVTDRLAARLLDASEGNPFFTRELVVASLSSGALGRDEAGELDLIAGPASTEIPETIQQAVESRLERLPEELRELLSVASVIGRSFEARDLAALAASQIDDRLDRLVADGILEEEREGRGDRLAFASSVVRDAVYSACPRRRRRNLHRRFAEHLEARHAGRLERVEAQLVHHFAAADAPAETVSYGLAAARRFLAQFAAPESAAMARAALEFLEDEGWEGEPSLLPEARRLLAAALAAGGDPAGAFREALAAVAALELLGSPLPLGTALLEAAEIAWLARLVEDARSLLERALPLVRDGGDTALLTRALRLASESATLRGEYESARRFSAEMEGVASGSSGVVAMVTPAPRRSGGRLVVPSGNAVFSLDPALVAIREQAEILPCVFETLTRVAGGARAVPWLAADVEPEAGGRRWRFRLRDGVRFHDGRKVRARDVRFSFERLLQHGDAQGRRLLSPIVGARALATGEVGDLAGFRILSTLDFTLELERPVPFLPELLSDCPTAILPEGTDRIDGPGEAIGTGPFRAVRFEPGARLLLERNPDYWREGLPLADEICFELAVPSEEIVRRFRDGTFSLAADLRPEDAEALRQDPEWAAGYRERPRLSTYWLAFNTRRGAMADPELRRALAVAIDPQALVRRSLGRAVLPARTLIAPGLPGHDDTPAQRPTLHAHVDGRTTVLPSRPPGGGAAKRALGIAVSPAFFGDGQYSALLREIEAPLARLGWGLEIRNRDTPGLFRELARREADLVLARWAVDYPDADSFAHGVLHSEEGWIGGFVGSAPLDRTIERARLALDPAERRALYREIEAFLAREALLVPLFHEQVWRFVHPSVSGLAQLGFLEPTVAYEHLSVSG